MIVGFYISFHAPSQSSFLYCMRMAIMPKDDILARFPDVVGPWPARGIMELIASDNGMEEHGNTVEAVCLEMGVILQFCGVAHPEMKGCIERTIGTVQRSLFHRLPGTTFSNIRERGEYKSEDNAALDIEVLTHALVKWIVDVYHKTPHRGLQVRTPLDVWQEAESRTAIELPAFPQQLENIVAIEYTRSLFHYGIQVNNLFYNSPLLQSLRAKTADTLVLRLRTVEDDVGHILVFNPEQGEFFDVPAVNQEYAAGLNGYVHKLIHAETVKRFGNDWRSEQLMEVKAEIQAIVDAAVKDKKMANRKQSAKLRLIDSEQVFRPVSEEPFNISRQPVIPSCIQ
jgi:putative transposase